MILLLQNKASALILSLALWLLLAAPPEVSAQAATAAAGATTTATTTEAAATQTAATTGAAATGGAGTAATAKAPADEEEEVEPDPDPILRVACVGDSLTTGKAAKPYPNWLKELLGPGWLVSNFGKDGGAVSSADDIPYFDSTAHMEALAFAPDHVVIMLGTNDAKEDLWVTAAPFLAEYKEIIDTFADLDSAPQIWICTPTPMLGNFFGLEADLLNNDIVSAIYNLEGYRDARLIDVHSQFPFSDAFYDEAVHPNTDGTRRLAEVIHYQLSMDGPGTPALVTASKRQGRDGSWRDLPGFGRIDTAYFPWIHHPDLGWAYALTDDPASMWLWSLETSYAYWTSNTIYPFLYGEERERWYYLLDNPGGMDWVYDMTSDFWDSSPFNP